MNFGDSFRQHCGRPDDPTRGQNAAVRSSSPLVPKSHGQVLATECSPLASSYRLTDRGYLKYALAVLQVFIGSKILVADAFGLAKIPPVASLSITFAILAAGAGWSLWKTRGVRPAEAGAPWHGSRAEKCFAPAALLAVSNEHDGAPVGSTSTPPRGRISRKGRRCILR